MIGAKGCDLGVGVGRWAAGPGTELPLTNPAARRGVKKSESPLQIAEYIAFGEAAHMCRSASDACMHLQLHLFYH